MNKKILYIIFGVLVLIAVGIFVVFNNTRQVQENSFTLESSRGLKIDNVQDVQDSSVSNIEAAAPKLIDQNTKDKVWSLLEQYIKYAENKDVEKIISLSYQVSDACKNYGKSEENKKDCDTKMNTAYFVGKELKKDKLVFLWQDKKQIILASDFVFEENEAMISKSRAMVYIILDSSNNMKVLSYNHEKVLLFQR